MNALRELRLRMGIPVADMVAVVRQIYPGYDKALQSKCEHGDRCGVNLRTDAMDALYAAFDPNRTTAPGRRKKDAHRLPCAVKARLDQTSYAALQQAIRANGYTTMQDWLANQVRAYIVRSSADV